MAGPLSVVVVGAHPDDCEIVAGGLTVRLRQAGHRVTYITTTNGDAGHQAMDREALARRRAAEARRVAEVLDVEYLVMDNHDGCLEATLAVREALIRLLRRADADLVITHPLDDYHPDHRNTARSVIDTAFMLCVPLCVPDTPPLRKSTAYCHIAKAPQADALNIVVPVTDQQEVKLRALHQNTSQIYEWLPWVERLDVTVPDDEAGRIEYLREWTRPRLDARRKAYAEVLASKGHRPDDPASPYHHIETFAAARQGFPLTCSNVRGFFPFDDLVVF